MADESRKNPLAEILRTRGGFVPIDEAIEILGAGLYTRCLANLLSRSDEDPDQADLFYKLGDGLTEGVPTHICFSSAFFEQFCKSLDDALERQGVLSPRTEGVKVV